MSSKQLKLLTEHKKPKVFKNVLYSLGFPRKSLKAWMQLSNDK